MNPVWGINERTNDKVYTGMLSLFRDVARNGMVDHKHNKDIRRELGITVINNLAF
jgi:hypothetical protein